MKFLEGSSGLMTSFNGIPLLLLINPLISDDAGSCLTGSMTYMPIVHFWYFLLLGLLLLEAFISEFDKFEGFTEYNEYSKFLS